MRNGMPIEEYQQDVVRLENELAAVNAKIGAYGEAESEMLKYVLMFSELVKSAKEYYKHALDTEKQETANLVFSELYLHNGKVAKVKAKDGFGALLKRHFVHSGSPEFCFSELLHIFMAVKLSMSQFKNTACLKRLFKLASQKKTLFAGLEVASLLNQ